MDPVRTLALILVVAIAGCARAPLPSARLMPVIEPPAPSGGLATEYGLASFYGAQFHGKLTASAIPFDMRALVAAHPTYTFGTLVRVTNLLNGRHVVVRIVDRGPARRYQGEGVIIDLSHAAADSLRGIRRGRIPVRVEILAD